MTITLYELRGANPDHRFSPYCWRVKAALVHKGLEFDPVTVRFTDKGLLDFSGQGKVPVLVDGDTVVSDSLHIFRYLDQTYPERPLLAEPLASARAESLTAISNTLLMPGLFRLLLPTIYQTLDPQDQPYFRQTREKFLGESLESYSDPARANQELKPGLAALAAALKKQPYFDGETPAGADYLIWGFFMWAYVLGVSFWKEEPVLADWFERLLQRYEHVQGKVLRING